MTGNVSCGVSGLLFFFFQSYSYRFLTLQDRSGTASSADNEDSKLLNPRKNLEEEYLDYEAKVHSFYYKYDFKCNQRSIHLVISRLVSFVPKKVVSGNFGFFFFLDKFHILVEMFMVS